MAKAKKLPSGSWRCQVYDYTDSNGKRHYKSFTCDDPTAKGKRKCELMAAEFAEQKDNIIKSNTNITFDAALQKYIDMKTPVLSPATIRGYLNIQVQLINGYALFMSKPVREIAQEDVQAIINNLSKNKSPKTVRNYHGLISAVIAQENPSMALHTTMPQRKKPDLYIPTDDEIKKLVSAVRGTELEIPVLLGAFCTMRRGEICGLSMDDIDGNIIHVHHSLVNGPDGKYHLKDPKTESSDRYIDAPQFVIDRINEVGHITNLTPHSITIMFNRVLTRNNIPHFRFHDLRHYSASIQHALGIPDAYIMERGGWSSDTVLKAVYRHTMSDRQKEMSAKANKHFSDLCNTKCNTKKIKP